MTIRILRGLPDALRKEAAVLYWDAFSGKLGRVMGPQVRAQRFLASALRSDHAFCALGPKGELLGLAGFKSPTGSFAGGTAADLRRAYGGFGAAWRGAILGLLERDVENQRFLVDGLCVARQARGQGIGSALLHQLFNEAQARGYSAIRLDVIESNWRARALYERLGFVASHTDRLGLVRHAFGFDASTVMVRPLTQRAEAAGAQ